jgi:hypothetical protein
MPETSLLDESIAKLEALKRKRTSLKARITRIQNFVSNFQSNDNDVSPLETRKTFIEQIFKEYDEVQTEIESLDLSSEAIETQTQDRDEIDLKYLDVLSSIQTKIRQTTPPPHTAATANPNGSCSSANSHCSNRDQSIKLNLPTLNLKSFTGCYKEWLSFQNSFKSIIEDENNMLNNCQRFQYLRSCLSGEALRAVESLTVSSENYNVAWDILKKRFCNKRLIVHDHIIAITKAPQVIKASHSSLRCFLDTLNSNVAALRQLEVPIDTWHALLVVIIVDKLDDNLAREWQATLTDEVPTYGQTIEFLEKKCQLLESLNLLHPKSNVNPNHNNAKNNMSQKRSTTSYVATNKLHCTFCKNDDHTIFQCNEFTKLNVEERNAQARNLKLCLNCLRTNHFVNNCQSKFKCRKCNQSHNTLLHKERQITQTNETPAQVESLNAHSMRSQSSIILLSTAIVLIEDRNNKSHKCRALLDAGSMNSYITSSFSKKLRLQQKAVNITVGGIGQISTNIKQAVQVNIKSQYNKFSANLSCFVLEKITENLPLVTINMSAINIPKELQLADPKFLETAPVDLLIGADLFWNLLCQDRKEITLKNHNKLMLQNTHLGFIAGGSLNMNNNNSSSTCSLSLTSVTDILENQVQKFFELEQCSNPSEQKCFSNEEIMCEQHFIQNTCRQTKREILSKTAQVFDPLGLVAPVVVKAKIILQQCWSLKIGWDDLLPETIYCAWVKILQELAHLNEIEIPRNIIKSSPVQVQLHGFGDASQIAYGAAVYLRTTDHSGNHQVHLICAKSRVAPLRAVTLPRLELCAALTLSRLFNTVLRTINVKIDQQFLWTDSTVVLAWINATSSNLQTFVGNRVSEIQTLTDAKDWYHVKSESNPADVLSRGALPGQLKTNKLWWNGPDWLSENNDTWPVSNVNLSDIEIPERRTVTLTNIHSRERQLPLLTKFSNYKKTERVMSWVLRFINNCRKPNQRQISSSLTCEELKDSMKAIMRLIQEVAFNDELACLKQNKPINKKSRLLCLNIFLDKNDNLIRAGGRLQNSSLTYDVKHPIVLPNDHHLIKALVKHVHIEQLHAGVQGTLAALRQNFWIISPRSVVRKILHQCLQCFKVKPSVMYPIMGNLPKSRVEPTRPFSISGVDYAGPIYIKECRGRSKRTVKAYICVFVCFSTKAVHLELVGDLTTQTFLNALKRFISRRGHVYHLYSDNATNFVGANRELLELRTFLKSASFSQITENLANKGISWHFIPPRSPHMGGIWEINVKSIKGHLKRTIGEVVLSCEELYTLLTRIEAVLNSRPLCPLSNDPNDLNPITPGHFLIGEPLTSISERDLTTTRINRLTQWQRVEQMRQHFWHRWQREYLVQNINRSKQLRGSGSRPSTPALEVGSMVILVEDNTPPLQWKLGRIVELHPGSDGVVRVVSVKTVNGIFKRATRKVCVLPANE